MKSTTAIRRILRRIRTRPTHGADIDLKWQVLGSEYGGWPLLDDTPIHAVVFSFGIGTDISFDCAAIKRFGCVVHGFDPTPRSLEWISGQPLPDGFSFHAMGLAEFDGIMSFEPPDVSTHVSFSRSRGDQKAAADAINAPVQRLESIITTQGVGLPEIVKMDIEGSEYGVISDVCSGTVRPRQLLVEFHHDLYGFTRQDTKDAVSLLRGAGYRIFYVADSGREYGFFHVQ